MSYGDKLYLTGVIVLCVIIYLCCSHQHQYGPPADGSTVGFEQ